VPEPQDVNQLLRFSHVGIQFVLVFGAFVFVGLKLDGWVGTVPLFTILGVLLGFALAFYQLYVSVFGAGRKPGDPKKGA
jgi:F0F1-type ATP synthase assembly protein I